MLHGNSRWMGEGMKISMTDMLYALSGALDCVEHELIGAETHHAKRVAYLSILIGREFGFSESELADLACAAALHDNALSEYVASEVAANEEITEQRHEMSQLNMQSSIPLSETQLVTVSEALKTRGVGEHCVMGERNVSLMPFYPRVKGVVLYHHENADGSGPFHLAGEDIPLYARIVHLADLLDVAHTLIRLSPEKYGDALGFAEKYRGKLFCPAVVDAFLKVATYENLARIQGERVHDALREVLPPIMRDYSDDDVRGIATIFAHITDYKSSFTRKHSEGVALKAAAMAGYYDMGPEMETRLYLAGALHDIGKLVIDNDILEKPGKLTDEEFTEMKNHAWFTWKILSDIDGFEEITRWAAFHHEKLDGSGYPFGKHGYELNPLERLMGCIDVYQALTEARPYKKPIDHEAALAIMRTMVDAGKLDGTIVDDIDGARQQGLFATPA